LHPNTIADIVFVSSELHDPPPHQSGRLDGKRSKTQMRRKCVHLSSDLDLLFELSVESSRIELYLTSLGKLVT